MLIEAYRRYRPWLVGAGGLAFAALSFVKAGSATTFLQFTVIGIAVGSVYALAAAGVVLTYTTTGIFNFAHGAIGMVATMSFWKLSQSFGWPVPLALLVVLGVIGPLLSLALELMFRRFRDADVSTTIVLTIAVMVLCIGVAQKAFVAPEGRNLPLLFGERYLEIAGTRISWDSVLQIVVTAAIAVGLRILLFRSRQGTAMRAVVDNPNLAALNGASPVATARLAWFLGTELAVLAGILIGAGTALEPIALTFFVVNAYGAAVFGKLKSLPLTFVGGIVLGLAYIWGRSFTFPRNDWPVDLFTAARWAKLAAALPAVFLFLALLALPQARLTVGRVVGRRSPTPPTLVRSIVYAVVGLAAAAAFINVLSPTYHSDAIRAMVIATLMLSLVVLTGYSGQVSLAQYLFLALGTWAASEVGGGTSVVSAVAAAAVAIPIGALAALPALRLQGLYLALATFGFAALAQDILLGDQELYGAEARLIDRLDLFGISFEGDKMFFFLCATVFAAVAVGVLAIRRGALGRRLAAVRDSQAACATLGLDTRRTKLLVFCLSAAIAGLAGWLFGGLNGTVSAEAVSKENSIILFLFAMVGGVTSILGAVLGGTLFALLPLVEAKWPDLAGIPFVLVAAVAVGLGRQPNGLAGIVYERWERLRRPREPAALAPPPAPVEAADVTEVQGALA